MAYQDELQSLLRMPSGVRWNCKITLLDQLVIVEGHRGLVYCGKERIQVRMGKRVAQLDGEDLTIVRDCDHELIVRGKWSGVQFV